MLKQKIYLFTAGFNILIRFNPSQKLGIFNSWTNRTLAKEIENQFHPFIVKKFNKKIDFIITIFQYYPKIFINKKKLFDLGTLYFFQKNRNEIRTFQHISINQFNYILLIVLQNLSSKSGGFILHASASIVKKALYVFCAPSGGGKSTALNLMQNKYEAFADDTVVVRNINGSYVGFQTPIIEKNSWIHKSQKYYPIRYIFMLRKSKKYHIKQNFKNNRIISLLSKQFFITDHSNVNPMHLLLKFIDQFKNIYFLHFKKDKDLPIVLENWGN